MVATLVHSGPRLWSINALADEFGIDRRTVKKRLEGIAPAGVSGGGHPAWRLRDAAAAVLGLRAPLADGAVDPDKLQPKDRLDHYRAEREKAKWELEQRVSIPAPEVEAVVAEAFKALSQGLDSIPDVLEKDCALGAKEVELAIDVVDGIRYSLYEKLLDLCNRMDQVGQDDAHEPG